jgi:hypothetical protein
LILADFITYTVANFNYFFGLGLSLLLGIVCFMLYDRTANRGFISILVGIGVSVGWTCFRLIVLDGVYFGQNLHNSGMAHDTISIVLMIEGSIALGIYAIEVLTLIVGLFIIANELPKKSYNSIQ